MRALARYAAFVLLAAAATSARGQVQPLAMRTAVGRNAEIVTGRWDPATTTGVDLMAMAAASTPGGSWWAHGDLLTSRAADYTGPASTYALAAGWFDAASTGEAPDLIWGEHRTELSRNKEVAVSWGTEPTVAPDLFQGSVGNWVWGAASVRLLPRAQSVPLLITGLESGGRDQLTAIDLADAHANPLATPPSRTWPLPAADSTHLTAADGDSFDRIYPVALSPAARAGGAFPIQDAVVPLAQGFYLLWHDAAPTDATLGGLNARAVEFGRAGFLALSTGGFLPFGAPLELDVLGAATANVDGDGVPDLVFSYGSDLFPGEPGWLFWIRNTGDVDTMQSGQQSPWSDLKARNAELKVIEDVGVVRPLDLGLPDPAFGAVDRSGAAIYVVTGSGQAGFQVLRLPLPVDARVRDMVAADVVGSPARDLVVVADLATIPVRRELWVFPDAGDPAPSLEWDPVPPQQVLLGAPVPLSVDASDPDGADDFTLRWLRPPAADVVGPASIVIPGEEICDASLPLAVTVRALDVHGVYVERSASVTVVASPSLTLVGSDPAGRLVLAPGGASGRAVGEAWPGCAVGAPNYAWGALGLSGLIQTATQAAGSAGAWLEFSVPESAYPEALAGAPALTLEASGPTTTGSAAGIATLPLRLDARGLVGVAVSFDPPLLREGELALARATIESRVGVALPRVRVAFRLDGLAVAGPVEVIGAAASAGAGPGEVVLDPLPAVGAPVELRLPVRSLGSPGAVTVEVFSEGSHRLSPESTPGANGATSPGCSCGVRGAGQFTLLFLLALVARRRPRAGRAT